MCIRSINDGVKPRIAKVIDESSYPEAEWTRIENFERWLLNNNISVMEYGDYTNLFYYMLAFPIDQHQINNLVSGEIKEDDLVPRWNLLNHPCQSCIIWIYEYRFGILDYENNNFTFRQGPSFLCNCSIVLPPNNWGIGGGCGCGTLTQNGFVNANIRYKFYERRLLLKFIEKIKPVNCISFSFGGKISLNHPNNLARKLGFKRIEPITFPSNDNGVLHLLKNINIRQAEDRIRDL